MTTRPSDPNAPPESPDECPDGDRSEETGAIPIFHMSRLVVEEEQTRFANVPSGADDFGLRAEEPRSATHPTQHKRLHDRYAFATEALVTTPGGKQCICQTVNVSPEGLLADGPAGKESPLRLGMVCRVKLRRASRVIEFEAEIVRVEPPNRNRGPSFAFRISFLTRQAQSDLLRLIEEAKAPGAARSSALSLSFAALAKVGGGLLLAAIAATAGWYFTRGNRAMSVLTTSVVRGSIADVVTSRSGEILAEHRVIVRSSLVVPTVMKLGVRRGDRVTAGTVLAEASGDTVRNALTVARNKLAAAQARSARASQLAEEDEESVNRPDSSLQRLEKLQRAQDAARRARDAVTAAQADRDARASEVKKSQITAPFDGVVVDVEIQPGDLVAGGAPICDLLDDRALRVNAQFDEADIGRIREGLAVQVVVTGNKSVIRGTVDHIGEVVEFDARLHTVLVEIALPDRPSLRPGTTAKAEILLETKRNVLTLRRSALAGAEGKRTVFLVSRDSELVSREVRVGIVASDLVEVLGGLPEGSTVVADGSANGLANGLLVRVGK